MLRCGKSFQLARFYAKNHCNFLNCRNFGFHINDNEKSVEISLPDGLVSSLFSDKRYTLWLIERQFKIQLLLRIL